MTTPLFFVCDFASSSETYSALKLSNTTFFQYPSSETLEDVYARLTVAVSALGASPTVRLVGHGLGGFLLTRMLLDGRTGGHPCVLLTPLLYHPLAWVTFVSWVSWPLRYLTVPHCWIKPQYLTSATVGWLPNCRPVQLHQMYDAGDVLTRIFDVSSVERAVTSSSVTVIVGEYDYIHGLPASWQVRLAENGTKLTILPVYHEGWRDSTGMAQCLHDYLLG